MEVSEVIDRAVRSLRSRDNHSTYTKFEGDQSEIISVHCRCGWKLTISMPAGSFIPQHQATARIYGALHEGLALGDL